MKEYSDAQLVARARADDTYAFQLLIERYQAMAFSLAQHYIDETETARELVQDAFLQAYLSLDRLRDAARFKSWLYGIVLNTCRNWRRMHPDKTLSLDAQAMLFEDSYPDSLCLDPQEIVEERELQQLLRAAVGTLTPKNQVVAYLFYDDLAGAPGAVELDELRYRTTWQGAGMAERCEMGSDSLIVLAMALSVKGINIATFQLQERIGKLGATSTHRSPTNFVVHLIAGLIAYSHQDKKQSLHLGEHALLAA